MTPFHASITDAMCPVLIKKDIDGKELLEKIPLGRFGRPEEVAEAAHFLVKNTYANNCVLNLDGGLGAVV